MFLFNFLEMVFLLSLGITFILIFLVVYHFKQRLGALEERADALFEIVNDVVRELNGTRPAPAKAPVPVPVPVPTKHEMYSDCSPIFEELAEDEDDADEEDADDDSEDDESDKEGGDDTYEDDYEDADDIAFAYMQTAPAPAPESADIALDMQYSPSFSFSFLPEPTETEHNEDVVLEFEADDIVPETETAAPEPDTETETAAPEPDTETESAAPDAERKLRAGDLSKIPIHELKLLAISTGVCADPGKLKKPELVKLLSA
jgi:hypothetical protein